MSKIGLGFIKNSFSNKSILKTYSKAIDDIGLWSSEKKIIKKYFKEEDFILDIGCGTGRTTFNLYKEGYCNIIGLDLSGHMLKEARLYGNKKGIHIKFIESDIMNYRTNVKYSGAFFSYNGIMHIPQYAKRRTAFSSIYDLLKDNAYFIFTTHEDRNKALEHVDYWKQEETKWNTMQNDPRLFEVGDIIVKDKGSEIFMHMPTNSEVLALISDSNFQLVECITKEQLCEENDDVNKFSCSCKFWVVKK